MTFLQAIAMWIVAVEPAAVAAGAGIRSVRIAENLDKPLFVTHAPGDHDRLFILEQGGRIRIWRAGQILPTDFLNVDPLTNGSGERGLLGLAFHPDYPTTNAFFINYTDLNGDTVVARYAVSDDPDVANPTGDIIFTLDQPASNHNGGWMGFGPDGYLYIALGDGGGQGDPNNLGQRTDDLLGNLLRIDVDGDDFPEDLLRDYATPADNPYVNIAGSDEIWATGLRNPWRCAFDNLTGDLYVADVGWMGSEEINFQPAESSGGENYGWRCFEGTTCLGLAGCSCATLNKVDPVYLYPRTPPLCAITGGEVYRGCAVPELDGHYFFGDYCASRIWTMTLSVLTPTVVERTSALTPPEFIDFISSFGRDAAGEVYICDYLGGAVLRVIRDPAPSLVGSDPPDEAIDARVPVDETMEPVGFDRVDWEFDVELNCTLPAGFAHVQGGDEFRPAVAGAEVHEGGLHATVILDGPIPPGVWTTLVHKESLESMRLGFLPGDVDASRVSSPLDILALVDALNGAAGPLPDWSADIDWSGVIDAADALTLVQLLNGEVDGLVWSGAMLP